jgi:hypothetical protein
VGRWVLTAKFDLVLLRRGQALIVDWKTSRFPKREALEQRAQTFIYPLVMALGGGAFTERGEPIPPDAIRMVYWYAATGQTHEFAYSAAQFERDRERLAQLFDDIDRAHSFPMTEQAERCRFCVYRSLCDRGVRAGSLSDYDLEAPDDALDAFTLDLDQSRRLSFELARSLQRPVTTICTRSSERGWSGSASRPRPPPAPSSTPMSTSLLRLKRCPT